MLLFNDINKIGELHNELKGDIISDCPCGLSRKWSLGEIIN